MCGGKQQGQLGVAQGVRVLEVAGAVRTGAHPLPTGGERRRSHGTQRLNLPVTAASGSNGPNGRTVVTVRSEYQCCVCGRPDTFVRDEGVHSSGPKEA